MHDRVVCGWLGFAAGGSFGATTGRVWAGCGFVVTGGGDWIGVVAGVVVGAAGAAAVEEL